MSIKTTCYINRAKAIQILLQDIPSLPNDTLGDLLDRLADSGQSRIVSRFNNFIVSEYLQTRTDVDQI